MFLFVFFHCKQPKLNESIVMRWLKNAWHCLFFLPVFLCHCILKQFVVNSLLFRIIMLNELWITLPVGDCCLERTENRLMLPSKHFCPENFRSLVSIFFLSFSVMWESRRKSALYEILRPTYLAPITTAHSQWLNWPFFPNLTLQCHDTLFLLLNWSWYIQN